jgi:hypothetical protein
MWCGEKCVCKMSGPRILRARSPRMRITRGGGGLSLSGQDSYNSMFRFPKRNPAAARRRLRRHTP